MGIKVRSNGAWVNISTGDANAASSISAVSDGPIFANTPVILTNVGLAKSITTVAESQASSPSTFLTGSSANQIYNVQSATWDTGQNVVIATWAVDSTTTDEDERVKIQAGSISGTSMTWGTSNFTITSSNQGYTGITTSLESTVASNGNAGGILCYKYMTDNAGPTYEIWANTFTVSGTNITLGNTFQVSGFGEGSGLNYPSITHLGQDGGSDYYAAVASLDNGDGWVKILKHDGQNSITQGTGKYFNNPHTADANNVFVVPISLDRFVIFWDNSDAVVCTRSGTEVFVGGKCEIGGEAGTILSGAYDSINDRVVFASETGVVKVCTVSGTNISLSFESRFEIASEVTGTTGRFPKLAVTDKGQILVSWQNGVTIPSGNVSYGYQIMGTYNDARTVINWATKVNWRNEDVQWVQLVNADDGKIVTVYAEKSTPNGIQSGKSWVTQAATTTLTKDNFFGFPDKNYTNGQSAIVNVTGKTTTQSGLTINEKYFVQDDGTIGIGRSSFGVLAGKALSATSLLITPDYYDTTVQSAGGGGGSSGGGGATTTPIVVTSNTTAASNQLIIVNNSGLTITLPASPNVADVVEVRVLGTRYCTVARNSSKIESIDEDFYIDTMDGYVKLIYTDATRGWIISS